jgi:hypothetical protein
VPAGVGVLGLDRGRQRAHGGDVGELQRVQRLAQLLGPPTLGREGDAQVVDVAQELGMGGVGLVELARPQAQEAEPVHGHRGGGGEQLHGGPLVAGERRAVAAAQREHAHRAALDQQRAPGLAGRRPRRQRPADRDRVGGQLAVAVAGAEPAVAAGRPKGRPRREGLLGEQDRSLLGLEGLAGPLQQGGTGGLQVLAAGEHAERRQQALETGAPPPGQARSPRSRSRLVRQVRDIESY